MGDDNKVHHEYERVVVSREGTTAREIRIYGSGGRLIFEGRAACGQWVVVARPCSPLHLSWAGGLAASRATRSSPKSCVTTV